MPNGFGIRISVRLKLLKLNFKMFIYKTNVKRRLTDVCVTAKLRFANNFTNAFTQSAALKTPERRSTDAQRQF